MEPLAYTTIFVLLSFLISVVGFTRGQRLGAFLLEQESKGVEHISDVLIVRNLILYKGYFRSANVFIISFLYVLSLSFIALEFVFQLQPVGTLSWIGMALMLFCLSAAAGCDFESMYLPDVLNYGFFTGLILAWEVTTPTWQGVALATATTSIFLVVNWSYLKLRGTEAIGGGDLKFIAIVCLTFTHPIHVIAFLGLASALVLIVKLIQSGFYIVKGFQAAKRSFDTQFPFGPYLILSFLFCLFTLKVT